MMSTREERRQQITEQRREQILEAVITLFSRVGYERSTIPAIAREANVAVGTIYNYFPTKRDLLLAIADRYIFEPFRDAFKQGQATPDIGVFISGMIENRLHFIKSKVDHFFPLLMEVMHDAELFSRYQDELIRPLMKSGEAFIASRVNREAAERIDPAIIPRVIGGMVIGFMLLYRIEGETSPIDAIDTKKLANDIAAILLNGLNTTVFTAPSGGPR